MRENSGFIGNYNGGENLGIRVEEGKDLVKLTIRIGNLAEEEMKFYVSPDSITIKKETRKENERKEENGFFHFSSYGSFSQTINLPSRVNPKQFTTKFKDGILEVKMEKERKIGRMR